METKVYATREIFNNTIAFFFSQATHERCFVAAPLAMVEVKEGESFGEPFMRLKITQAQRLIDELWNCGLRPSEGTGSAGSLRATEKHLADMQKIAFSLLEKHGATPASTPAP